MSTQEVDLEDGWATLKILISKLIDRVEGGLKPYSGDEVMDAHRIIYKLCSQKLPHDNDEFLYNRYKTFLSDYINETVLPSLKDKRNDSLLKELTERWPKYLSTVKCISCLFDYLDHFITVTRSLPSLKIVGVTCFFSLVYTEIHATIKDAVLALAEKYLNEEDGWASCLLKQSNHFTLMKNLRLMWLHQCESEKLKSYFSSLLLNERKEDLKRMYDLFGPHKGLDTINLLFKQYLTETMATLGLEDSHRGFALVLDKHLIYLRLITECFGGNSDLHKVLKESLDLSRNRQQQVSYPADAESSTNSPIGS